MDIRIGFTCESQKLEDQVERGRENEVEGGNAGKDS